jgi:hypothetical protein
MPIDYGSLAKFPYAGFACQKKRRSVIFNYQKNGKAHQNSSNFID